MNFLVLDIETTGLNPRRDKIHGVGVATLNPENEIVCDYITPDNPFLKKFLADPTKNVIGHNLRFDLKFLHQFGLEINCQTWDTKLLAQVLDENQRLGLKDLAVKHFGEGALLDKRKLDSAVSKIKGKSVADLCKFDLEDPSKQYFELIADYCKEDCKNTLALFRLLWQTLVERDRIVRNKLFPNTPLSYFLEECMPLEKVLMSMELRGIALKVNDLLNFREVITTENNSLSAQMSLLAAKEITAIEEELYEKAKAKKKTEEGKANVQKRSIKYGTKFNWNSNNHLSQLIFGNFGVDPKNAEKTEIGSPSTSETSIDRIIESREENDRLKQILETYKKFKKNLKLVTTYTGDKKGLLAHVEDGRVYAEYLQAGRGKEGKQAMMGGTVTGRLSSRNPNLQNLPRNSPIQKFFVPDMGRIFAYFDYSQLELRLAAHLSQDKMLMEAYIKDLDLHEITAKAIDKDRQTGKAVNFAMIYDASPYRLSEMIAQPVEECREIINNFFSLYRGYKEYLNRQRKFLTKYNGVFSETGRFRNLPEINQYEFRSREWSHALKQGYNFPIQSLGASITKRALIELHKQGFSIVTTVHDSVVVEIAENEKHLVKDIKAIAENIYPLTVPLKADVKLLTSLSESDIIQEKEINDEQHSDNRTNQARGNRAS